MKLVLDASVALSWLKLPNQPFHTQAMDILNDLQGSSALVPAIWSLEVAQGALRVERSKAATTDELARFTRLVRSAPIVHDSRPPDRWLASSVSLARTHGLTVYDASYLELALTSRVPLATFDRKLASVARALDLELAAQTSGLAEPIVGYDVPASVIHCATSDLGPCVGREWTARHPNRGQTMTMPYVSVPLEQVAERLDDMIQAARDGARVVIAHDGLAHAQICQANPLLTEEAHQAIEGLKNGPKIPYTDEATWWYMVKGICE